MTVWHVEKSKKSINRFIQQMYDTGNISSKQNILIKPNMVSEEPYPTTTDPTVLSYILDSLNQNHSGKITISDGPAPDKVYVQTGKFDSGEKVNIKKYYKEFREHFLGKNDFSKEMKNKIEERSKQIINGLKLKTVAEEHKTDIVSMYDFSFKQCSYNNTNFRIANLEEYDILLNLPVLKLHSHCFYTAANKNLYGLIYHFDKNNLHAEAEKNEFNFLEFIEHIPDFIAPKIITMLDASIIQDTQERVWGAQKTFNINRELICGNDTHEIDNFIELELKQHNITKPYFFEHLKKSN